MAWLRLTTERAQITLVNTDQITEICQNRSGCGCKIWGQGSLFDVRESVDEIAAMIELAERAERVDGIFRAIVPNFPHGYDPLEIVDTARRLLDALDKSREL